MNESVTFPEFHAPGSFPPARAENARPGTAAAASDTDLSRASRQLRAWLRRTAVGLGAVQLLLDAGRPGEAGRALATLRGDFQLLRYALDTEAGEGRTPGRGPTRDDRRDDVRKN
jgi:hypothetical protein